MTDVVFVIWPIVEDDCFCELCVSIPGVPMVVISVVKTEKILRSITLAAIIAVFVLPVSENMSFKMCVLTSHFFV